jgi:hypothetical protein
MFTTLLTYEYDFCMFALRKKNRRMRDDMDEALSRHTVQNTYINDFVLHALYIVVRRI